MSILRQRMHRVTEKCADSVALACKSSVGILSCCDGLRFLVFRRDNPRQKQRFRCVIVCLVHHQMVHHQMAESSGRRHLVWRSLSPSLHSRCA